MTSLYQLVKKTCIDDNHEKFDNIIKLLCSIKIPKIHDCNQNKSIPKCSICLNNNTNIALIPCGHVCSCYNCSNDITKCPICRSDIIRKQPLFYS